MVVVLHSSCSSPTCGSAEARSIREEFSASVNLTRDSLNLVRRVAISRDTNKKEARSRSGSQSLVHFAQCNVSRADRRKATKTRNETKGEREKREHWLAERFAKSWRSRASLPARRGAAGRSARGACIGSGVSLRPRLRKKSKNPSHDVLFPEAVCAELCACVCVYVCVQGRW